MAQSYAADVTMAAAIQSYDRLRVREIILHVSNVGKRYDGSSYQYIPHTGMAISFAWDGRFPDQTHLTAGIPWVISINNTQWSFALDERVRFSKYIVHELPHPYVPDREIAPGNFDDHQDMVANGLVDRVRANIFGL